jgi:ABC-type lipoprotein release transport system permease subunit
VLTLRLAWRNVWRNPRRTGVVVTAVSVGIAGVVFSVALNYGMIVQMVETAIATELGHIQIHARGFDRNPEIAVRLEDGGRAGAMALDTLTGVRSWTRRVRGEGLVSSSRASVGVRVVGIEREREAAVSLIARSITQGRYLGGEGRRALLGVDLARRLQVGVGDKVVVSVQDLRGDLTGEALRVGGLFRTPSSALDRGTVFMEIAEAQALFGIGEAVSEIVVVTTTPSEIPRVQHFLEEDLRDEEVRSWGELQPVLVYLVDVFDEQAMYVYLALFVAMAFGIANVLLMAVFERVREIGILMAVGMRRRQLVAMIVVESIFVTLVGLAIGFAGALGAIAACRDGIDLSRYAEGLAALGIGTRIVPVLRFGDFLVPTAVALVTAVIASTWPALRAVRFRPADAVRQT